MSAFKSQGRIKLLAAHETDDYLAHLLRLDCDAQTRRFAGQLSPAALGERAKLAGRDAACVIVARIDGHIRAAAEFWEIGGTDQAYEFALSVEGSARVQTPGNTNLEAALMLHAICAMRERGVSRLIYMAGSSGQLPILPDGVGASPWRPWSDQGVWCCDLSKLADEWSSREASAPHPALPLRVGWGQRMVDIARRLFAGSLGREERA